MVKDPKITPLEADNVYWQVNGVIKAAGSYTYSHGTQLKVECFANSGYIKPVTLTME